MNASTVDTSATSINIRSAQKFTRTAVSSGATVRRIWMTLKITFSIVPIVAGLDKFTNLLTHWENYLNPMLARALPFSPHVFMGIVGVIEFIAGLVVFLRPRLGALIVSVWLTCIALSLLASLQYLDVAVRDLVMAISAFSLASLTPLVDSESKSTL